MKKAVITTGGKQYLVSEGEILNVELLNSNEKLISFEPLLVIAEEDVQIGAPTLPKLKVNAEVLAEDVQDDKVTSIRYKAKKRVHTVRGHRQHQTTLKIVSIA